MGCCDYWVRVLVTHHTAYWKLDCFNYLLEIFLCRPEGRTFRSKQEIKQYLFMRQLDHDLELFDFRLGENFYTSRGLEVPVRARKSTVLRTSISSIKKPENETLPTNAASPAIADSTAAIPSPVTNLDLSVNDKIATTKPLAKTETPAVTTPELETPTFVPEEDGYRCPVEDCRKLFRRDNLLGVGYK